MAADWEVVCPSMSQPGSTCALYESDTFLDERLGFIVAIAKVVLAYTANETSLLDVKLLESLGRSRRSDVNDYWTSHSDII